MSAEQDKPTVGQPPLLSIGRVNVVVAAVAVLAIVGANWGRFAWHASDGANVDVLRLRATALAESHKGSALLVVTVFEGYRSIAPSWSTVYNGCSLDAAALGLMAALVLKLESAVARATLKRAAAAMLASLGATPALLSSSGDFEMKWQAKRTAVARAGNIAIRLPTPRPPNQDEVNAKLALIVQHRHQWLTGAAAPASAAQGR